MTSPMKPWETTAHSLQNSTQLQKSSGIPPPSIRTALPPALPPMPRTNMMAPSTYNSYMPYSSGYSTMGSYGGYGGTYGSFGMPYRSSMYNSYGGYGGMYDSYGMGGGYGTSFAQNDAERRFIQYAEDSSRNTFANVESIVRAVNSISMMLDNTFFAMTSSFRAVLSVADNFGKLRSMFGHIWYSINVFRLFNWLYRQMMWLLGRKVPSSGKSTAVTNAWNQAAGGATAAPSPPSGSNWPTLAFLGVLVSAPYIISKFLPKYEDKCDPANWKSPGVRAKAAFDFVARSPNELTIQVNDELTLAPTYIQDEMHLKNSGWAYAVGNGQSGVVPLNYLVISKLVDRRQQLEDVNNIPVPPVFSSSNISNNNNNNHKTHQKRVSFGENQIFENVDLEDYVTGKKEIKCTSSNSSNSIKSAERQNNNKNEKIAVQDNNKSKEEEKESEKKEEIATTPASE